MGTINGNTFSGREYGHLEVPTSVPFWFSFNEFPKSLSEDFSLANGCRLVFCLSREERVELHPGLPNIVCGIWGKAGET